MKSFYVKIYIGIDFDQNNGSLFLGVIETLGFESPKVVGGVCFLAE